MADSTQEEQVDDGSKLKVHLEYMVKKRQEILKLYETALKELKANSADVIEGSPEYENLKVAMKEIVAMGASKPDSDQGLQEQLDVLFGDVEEGESTDHTEKEERPGPSSRPDPETIQGPSTAKKMKFNND